MLRVGFSAMAPASPAHFLDFAGGREQAAPAPTHEKEAPVRRPGPLLWNDYLLRSPNSALSNEFVLPFAYL